MPLGVVRNLFKCTNAVRLHRKLSSPYAVLVDWIIELADIYSEQDETGEAEQLLVEAYEACTARRADIDSASLQQTIGSILTHLVQLCQKSGQLDKAAKWRKELETIQGTLNQNDAEDNAASRDPID